MIGFRGVVVSTPSWYIETRMRHFIFLFFLSHLGLNAETAQNSDDFDGKIDNVEPLLWKSSTNV